MAITDLYIDSDVVALPEVQSIRERIGLPPRMVEDEGVLFREIASSNDPILRAKQILFLTRNRGAFIKACPGTSAYTCCGYQILHIGTFCSMDCAYCILQAYYHPPVLRFFVNHSEMLAEIERALSHNRITRIGTGEFTDSLIWEGWSDLTPLLVSTFSQQTRAVLELKTKTTAIEKLAGLSHNRKTIVAWSLNTDVVIANEERSTPALAARLRAAAECASWGYPLAFHFDPMIIYDGCERNYQQVLEQVFSYVDSRHIVWISLGTFRCMPSLKTIIQQRHPHSKIIYGEFTAGLDGKMRYFKPLRIALYQKMVSWIRALAPNVQIYLCMEDDETWQKALGYIPADRGGLSRMLDESAIAHCNLDRPSG